MKDWKIRTKLLSAFGVIIIMLVILTIVVVSTNGSSISNVNKIDASATLQTKANDALGTFNTARVQANIIYSIISDDANAAFRENAAIVEQQFGEIFAYIDENAVLAGSRSDMEEAYQYFVTWRAEVEKVIEYNNRLAEGKEKLVDDGVTVGQIGSAMLRDRLNGIDAAIQAGGSSLPEDIIRVNRDAQTAGEFADAVTMFRVDIRTFIETLDASHLDGILVNMDKAISIAEAYRDESGHQADEAAINNAIELLGSYREEVVEYGRFCSLADEAIARARPIGDSATAALNNACITLSEDVSTQIHKTSLNAMTAMIICIIVVLLTLVAAVVLALTLTRTFTRPLTIMQNIMRQAGETGNLDFPEETRGDVFKEAECKDEIGMTMKNFVKFVDRILYISNCLEKVASKDLSLDIELLGREDTMGASLKAMLDNLNNIFAEIRAVASQVSTASHEVALGAQTLAQGSTEQASTVQEISAAINEITGQSHDASKKASEAADFSLEIRQSAIEGNEKMTYMIQSVQEINEASQTIGNVIKAIDDIAFQTNILALNAAVEAARAGEHGKGFAVVADEVRNLAGKSADAASRTAELISANIEKAGAGMNVVNQTAESLQKIVKGIEQTSVSLQEIASQSEANQVATGNVNTAVDQVAKVVQQNSATSEESAAASEEMSSQAQQLQSLIAQFKLHPEHHHTDTPVFASEQAAQDKYDAWEAEY